MKVIVYSTKPFEKAPFEEANQGRHELDFVAERLSLENIENVKGHDAVCCFVADTLNEPVLLKLSEMGVRLIALRSAGYDHVDLATADRCGMTVVRVPDYSPESVAEFAVGLVLLLSRKFLKSYLKSREYNFALEDLVGFNLNQKTVGIIGAGKIGAAFAQIMKGFGCHLLGYDVAPNETCKAMGMTYVSLDELLKNSDIVSLHCPLNSETFYLLDEPEFLKMKRGALLINTARGAVINTPALIHALKSGHLGGAGLDVYEYEKGLFFMDHQGHPPQDTQFLELQSLPNVMITPHYAFLTQEAIFNIIKTTISNINAFEEGHPIHQIKSA